MTATDDAALALRAEREAAAREKPDAPSDEFSLPCTGLSIGSADDGEEVRTPVRNALLKNDTQLPKNKGMEVVVNSPVTDEKEEAYTDQLFQAA